MPELFRQNALIPGMISVEEDGNLAVRRFPHSYRFNRLDLIIVRDRIDRAFFSLQQIHTNIHMFWQERPAPTARTERAYWCQRQKWRFKRQNGTLRRKIVGRGTRRRR